MATDLSTSLSCYWNALLPSVYLSDTNPVRRCHVALMLHDTTSEADRYYVGDGGIPELHSRTQAPERRLFSVRPRRMKVIHEEVGSE